MTAIPVRPGLPQAVGWLLVAAALLAVLPPAPARAAHERLHLGDPVRFVLHTTRGRLTSRALAGRTYAVVFWNTGSKKFAQALPVLRTLVAQHATQNFVLIGYSVDPSANDTHRFIVQHRMRWAQALHQDQDFPFYDLFYTRRSPVPGAFLISDTGHLRWHGPLSQLAEAANAAVPITPGTPDPQTARHAAQRAYRALLRVPPDAARLRQHLDTIPNAAWTDDREVRRTLWRAARRLARLDPEHLQTLQDAAASDPHYGESLRRLRALGPEPRADLPHTPAQTTTPAAAPPAAPPPRRDDPASDAQAALVDARAALATGNVLSAWEHYRAAASDPQAGEPAATAQAELSALEDEPGFAQRLIDARHARAAGDLFVKALNLMAAGKPQRADATLRQIRREYHDTSTAAAAERALAQLHNTPQP